MLAPVRREPAAAAACACQCNGGRGRGGEPRRPGSGRGLLGPSSALTTAVFLPPRSPLFACFDVLGLIFARFYDSGFHLPSRLCRPSAFLSVSPNHHGAGLNWLFPILPPEQSCSPGPYGKGRWRVCYL